MEQILSELSTVQLIALVYTVVYLLRLRVSWVESQMASVYMHSIGYHAVDRTTIQTAWGLFTTAAFMNVIFIPVIAIVSPRSLLLAPTWNAVEASVRLMRARQRIDS